MWSDINWPTVIASALVALIAAGAGIVTAVWNRKSQKEANELTGSGQVFNHQSTLLQDVQEERNKAAADLKEEREANKRDISTLRSELESFKETVKSQFSGYRVYIHRLRGQVHDLGGVPIEWPKDLDQ
jgi:predicted  nucleic acid-binding Zn-ribbon protein